MLPPPSGVLGAAGVPVKLSPGDIPEQAASNAAASTTANRPAICPPEADAPCTIMRVAPFGIPRFGIPPATTVGWYYSTAIGLFLDKSLTR
jgi:hypothetical protein